MNGEYWPHSGCKALYHLNDLTDSSGNGYTLATYGTNTYSAGKFGDGLSNSTLQVGYGGSGGVDLSTKIYGLSFWFKITTQPPSGYGYELVQWNYRYGSAPYSYRSVRVSYAKPSSTLKIQLEPCAAGTLANFTATPGTWYKCDVTADGTTAYLYIDGVEYIEATIGTSDPNPSGDAIYIFGYGAEEVAGMMDEVAFFNYHRTDSEIRKRYAFETGKL